MSIAVIKTGGKQYQVSEGDKLVIEKIEAKEGESITFDQVLLVSDDKGADVKVGQPLVSGAKVSAKVLSQGKGDKVRIVKYKAKSNYRRVTGHRQHQTFIEIEKIA